MSKNRFTEGLKVWRRHGRVKIRRMKSQFRYLRKQKVSSLIYLCESRPDVVLNHAQSMKHGLSLNPGDMAYCWYTRQNERIKSVHQSWRHESCGEWLWSVRLDFESGYCSCSDECVARAESLEDIQQDNRLYDEYCARYP